MRLLQSGWLAYYSEFVTAPVIAFVGALLAPRWDIEFVLGMLVGFVTWQFVEWAIHRYVLHGAPVIKQAHDGHHEDPHGPEGVSPLITVSAWALILTACHFIGVHGPFFGLLAGYVLYQYAHDRIHNRTVAPGHWLYQAKLRHLMHHRGLEANFNVAFPLGDMLLGTYVPHQRRT